jgi:hypothetical protein
MVFSPIERGKPVHYQIEWQIFLRVKSLKKADQILDRFAQEISRENTKGGCERYWKDESLLRTTVRSALQAEEVAPAVLETLQLCSCIANQWMVTPPQFYDQGLWEFAGTADSRSIGLVGVVHVDFRVGNLKPVEPDNRPTPVKGEAPLLNPTNS